MSWTPSLSKLGSTKRLEFLAICSAVPPKIAAVNFLRSYFPQYSSDRLNLGPYGYLLKKSFQMVGGLRRSDTWFESYDHFNFTAPKKNGNNCARNFLSFLLWNSSSPILLTFQISKDPMNIPKGEKGPCGTSHLGFHAQGGPHMLMLNFLNLFLFPSLIFLLISLQFNLHEGPKCWIVPTQLKE